MTSVQTTPQKHRKQSLEPELNTDQLWETVRENGGGLGVTSLQWKFKKKRQLWKLSEQSYRDKLEYVHVCKPIPEVHDKCWSLWM